MKKITLSLVLITLTLIAKAQIITIPDANFEGALVNQGIDTDGLINNQITTVDALSITTLYVDNLGINDLTGINNFTNLTLLSCFGNNLANNTVLMLPNLQTLYIDNNLNITTLNLSNLPVLSVLNARNCNIDTIFPYSDLSIYTQIRLGGNNLIGTPNFTGLTNIEILEYSNNAITSVDVTGLVNLDFLALDNCGLNDLDLTTNVNLTNLTAIGNNLTCLDLSQNSLLTGIEVNNNDQNLVIVVTDVTAANAGTGIYQNWYKDATATYSTSCSTAATNDFVFENSFNIYPNPVKDDLYIKSENDSSYSIYDVTGKQVKKGIIQIGNNTLRVNNLQEGVYFLKINSSSKIMTKKIIIN